MFFAFLLLRENNSNVARSFQNRIYYRYNSTWNERTNIALGSIIKEENKYLVELKPHPCSVDSLESKGLQWDEITNNFNPSYIKEVLNLWSSKEEKITVLHLIEEAYKKISRRPVKIENVMNLIRVGGNFFSNLYSELGDKDVVAATIEEYMERHTATDADIDEIFAENSKSVESKDTEDEVPHVDNLSSSDKQIKTAVEIMKKEKVIKHRYDYAYIMKIMNETEDLPTFNSPKSFLDYFKDLGITDLPGEDSIKKKVNASFGSHPSWTFTDKKGKDANEAKRRNAVGSRFLSIYRKGK